MQRDHQQIAKLAEEGAERFDRLAEDADITLRVVSDIVGHENWPGDVDPMATHSYRSGIEGMLRQLIENGMPRYTVHPFGDECLFETDPDGDPTDRPESLLFWEAVELAESHRAEAIRDARKQVTGPDDTDGEELVRFMESIWYAIHLSEESEKAGGDLCEDPRDHPTLAGLVPPLDSSGADPDPFTRDDPRVLFAAYDEIGSDGVWPSPDRIAARLASYGAPVEVVIRVFRKGHGLEVEVENTTTQDQRGSEAK